MARFNAYVPKVPNEIRDLFTLIDNENKWKDAHEQFTRIRKFNLSNESFQFKNYIRLGEAIAKVIYNCSGFPAPFDHDSGWYIPSLTLRSAEYFNDAKLDEQIKSDILIFTDNKNLLKDFEVTKIYLLEMRNGVYK